jgi:hypothetical protein
MVLTGRGRRHVIGAPWGSKKVIVISCHRPLGPHESHRDNFRVIGKAARVDLLLPARRAAMETAIFICESNANLREKLK